jgi:hypothetical protein
MRMVSPDMGNDMTRKVRIVRRVGIFLGVTGMTGWVLAFLITGVPEWVPRWFEVPLGKIEGIAADKSGHIYCGLQPFYGRIQVYDSDGRFVRGWGVDSGGGVFRFRLNASDELEVASARTDSLEVFLPTGERIKHVIRGEGYEEFADWNPYSATSEDGARYVVSTPVILPRVERLSPDGALTTIITTRWWTWPLMAPVPAAPFCMAGIVLLLLCKSKKRVPSEDSGEREVRHSAPAQSQD